MNRMWSRPNINNEHVDDSQETVILDNDQDKEVEEIDNLEETEKTELFRSSEAEGPEEYGRARSIYNRLYKSNIKPLKMKRKKGE